MARKKNENPLGKTAGEIESSGSCCSGVDRRDFVKTVGLGAVIAGATGSAAEAGNKPAYVQSHLEDGSDGWPC